MSSVFQATVRRSGNSLVITIPKEVAQGLGVENGTIIRATIHLMGDKEEKA